VPLARCTQPRPDKGEAVGVNQCGGGVGKRGAVGQFMRLQVRFLAARRATCVVVNSMGPGSVPECRPPAKHYSHMTIILHSGRAGWHECVDGPRSHGHKMLTIH
jgi:hypothetical protein